MFLHIGINARRSNAEGWGDHPFALCLATAFRALGHEAELFFRDETPALSGRNDVAIRIIGPHLDEPVPGVPNLLWMISPPNLAPLATLRRYQKVLFASLAMKMIYESLGVDSAYLPQATDTARFTPGARLTGAPLYDITFVGNMAARAPRSNVRQAISLGYDVKVWGQGWEDVIPAANLVAPRLAPGELPLIYARSRVVLNSHMPMMSQLGFMSNRSFDALACGACVVSDRVALFDDLGLPWLVQAGDEAELAEALRKVLGSGPDGPPPRDRIAATVAARYDFADRARVLAEEAARQLEKGAHAAPAFVMRPAGGAGSQPYKTTIADVADDDAEPLGDRLDRLIADHALDVTLTLSDPSSSPVPLRPAEAMRRAALAIDRIGTVLSRQNLLAALHVQPPPAEARQGVVHAMMADHRAAQHLALHPRDENAMAALDRLCTRARRLLEIDAEEGHPLGWSRGLTDPAQALTRIMNNRPLYAHSPDGFSRDRGKRHLLLWPRKGAPALERPVGVFLHLFYDDLAPVLRDRLSAVDLPHRIYISTDTETKAAAIRASFPEALIRILPNRGRDVLPKLFGFADVHDRHDIILHLHGKKSPHSGKLDHWLDHSLTCLLPNRTEVFRILSLFQSVPELGMLAPLTYQAVLGAAHWGDNYDIARELYLRMGLPGDLPGDADLEFPVGSMFWARTAALRPLLALNLTQTHFPEEAAQVDATTAHAIERMFGVVCSATGHRLIKVAPAGSHAYKAHQLVAKTNGDLRQALKQGLFGD